METIQAYRASNGQLFETEVKCEECEVSILWREKISEFIESPYCDYQKNVHRSMCRKVITGWEQFKTKAALGD